MPLSASRPHDHLQQRGLARAVRPDHADDAAGRQRKIEVLKQHAIAIGFADALRLDHHFAQALAVGDDDLQFLAALFVFRQQFFIGGDARLAFGLPAFCDM